MPENCQAWTRFAALEASLEEYERARKIYELGVSQPVLDVPEVCAFGVVSDRIVLNLFCFRNRCCGKPTLILKCL